MSLDLADPNTRRAHIAMQLWGCPRPDKHHHMTRQTAEIHLDRYRNHPGFDPTARVYRCPCGGYVWGRSTRRRT
ncbi:hypothetical protein RDI86_01980 [Cellulosimicrobium sp. XJ-DQ-B-000]|uniref:hypothetical protein n=1 Tax=Cellulosimicrobium sp. XJ-DQ-B-000 TaxID=3072182 RepID=UPI002806A807|nr:hypothetical protein [Cellulosimicrobium sp. XJ-DQ-B-000]MDQ8040616.1 hypothetical protein [Cellulosimicrobium sp. XJ-DQ-B-000]